MKKNSIGELLLEKKIITKEQLEKAKREQKIKKGKLGSILVKLGYIDEKQLIKFMGKQFGIPSIFVEEVDITEQVVRLIEPKMAQKLKIFPVKRKGRTLFLAMVDPMDMTAISEVQFALGFDVKPLVSSESSINAAIAKYYKIDSRLDEVLADIEKSSLGGIEVLEEEEEADVGQLLAESGAAPIVKLVNTIILEAVNRQASDIHLEPFEKNVRVRYRIDGTLVEVMKPPKNMGAGIVSRIKIMSKLDLTERRLPQDGHIPLRISGRGVDLRVSTMPVLHGEKVVMRIAEQQGIQLDMRKLGLLEKPLALFLKAIKKPNGIILVTGPTGSGKTVTLYSALSRLNKSDVNIVTTEDPVEYNFYGINQVQVHEDIGYTFSTALRAILRQDPNIVMVGEIRDKETAEIAVKASLTGHLVLSTLHTNDCAATVMRLKDMGMPSYLLATSLVLIEAQRLVRKICEGCKIPVKIDDEMFTKMEIDPKWGKGVTLFKGKGCSKCNNSGYKGRIGIFEIMDISPEIKEGIISELSSEELQKLAISKGMISLRHDALMKMRQGLTTFEEVIKATAE